MIAAVILCMVGLSIDNVAAANAGDQNSNGLISRLLGMGIFNNYQSLASHHGSHSQRPVPPVPPIVEPVIGDTPTPTATVLPTPTPDPTVMPAPISAPTHVHYTPSTIESIYGTPTPKPGSNAAQTLIKPDNAKTNITVPSLLSRSPLSLADLSASMVVNYNIGGSHTVGNSDPAKSDVPDLLLILNLIIPVAAIGVILSDRLARKGK